MYVKLYEGLLIFTCLSSKLAVLYFNKTNMLYY